MLDFRLRHEVFRPRDLVIFPGQLQGMKTPKYKFVQNYEKSRLRDNTIRYLVVGIGIKVVVRLPLQSATPPHWANSPMAVRAIPASARHRRIAGRLPNRIQIMFWRAATFIQLLAWVDIKMLKAVEAWKQKRSV